MTYTLENEYLTVEINSYGAEVISARNAEGYEFIWNGAEWSGHAPILFPVCGRLLDGKFTSRGRVYEMKSHGFAKRSEFTVGETTENSVTFVLESNDETLACYPFEFRLEAKYELNKNTLCLTLNVINSGKHVMPYMIGWHPGFTLGGTRDICTHYVSFGDKREVTWHPLQHGAFVNPFYSSYPLKAGKYYLNEEEIYSNDTMIFKDVPETVKLAGGYQKHSVTLSYSKNLPYLCIWKAPSSSARFICLEPWSSVPADGETPENFDSRPMARLEAGSSEEYVYSVTFE